MWSIWARETRPASGSYWFFASGAQGLIMPFMGFTLPLRDASHHLAPLHALDFANR
jgi:hypothetical protein